MSTNSARMSDKCFTQGKFKIKHSKNGRGGKIMKEPSIPEPRTPLYWRVHTCMQRETDRSHKYSVFIALETRNDARRLIYRLMNQDSQRKIARRTDRWRGSAVRVSVLSLSPECWATRWPCVVIMPSQQLATRIVASASTAMSTLIRDLANTVSTRREPLICLT